MAWINSDDLLKIYPSMANDEDADPDRLVWIIEHVTALAEIEIGTQTEPVSNKLQAVTVQAVRRIWLATDDEGISQEQLGSYSYSRSVASGLGLTNAEKKLFRKAAGQTGLWVQGTDRGPGLETAGPDSGDAWLEGAL